MTGVEPATSWMQIRRSANWATSPTSLVAGTGFEPATFGLWAQRATRLLHPAIYFWWAWVDSNYRPHAYQACALTNWATGPHLVTNLQSRNKYQKTYYYLETHLVIKRTIKFDVWKLDMRRVSCNLNLLIKVAVLFIIRRWSSHRFSYSYLVTTSPQS